MFDDDLKKYLTPEQLEYLAEQSQLPLLERIRDLEACVIALTTILLSLNIPSAARVSAVTSLMIPKN